MATAIFFPKDYSMDKEGVIVTSKLAYVKQILQSDFQNFYYRSQRAYIPEFARRSVIFVNEDWKRIRSQVTPVFTSGRLKRMFKNFKHPIETTLENLDVLIKKGSDVDVRVLMRSFALDIIGNEFFLSFFSFMKTLTFIFSSPCRV